MAANQPAKELRMTDSEDRTAETKLPAPLLHPLTVGGISLPGNLALAPMAGATDLPFRLLCRGLGADLVCTELVSARGIRHDKDLHRTWRYVEIDPAEAPVAIQLFGSDPEDLDYAVRVIEGHPLLSRCTFIDLNMGCPVPKVVQAGDGSALMKDPARAAAAVRACVRAANRPVTVKIRKGWDPASVNAVEIARVCEAEGAAMVAVHGRTRDQMYAGEADWGIIAAVKAAIGVPVFGNGDVRTPNDARRILNETGVDGVMVGRAALGDPWIFARIRGALDPLAPKGPGWPEVPGEPTPAERVALMLHHLDLSIARYGEATAVKEFRKQAGWYMKGVRGTAPLRAIAFNAVTRADLAGVFARYRDLMQKTDPTAKKR
jgi:tRNA-dihydrouridine synthase B